MERQILVTFIGDEAMRSVIWQNLGSGMDDFRRAIVKRLSFFPFERVNKDALNGKSLPSAMFIEVDACGRAQPLFE